MSDQRNSTEFDLISVVPDPAGPDPVGLDLGGLEADRFRPSRRRILWRALLVFVVIVAAAVIVPSITYSLKRDQVVEATKERLQILSAGRVEVLQTWLTALIGKTDRLVESELFRLFATEVDNAGGSLSAITRPHDLTPEDEQESELGVALVEQIPFIERVLTDFANSADFLDGYLYGRNGDPYVATAGAVPANDAKKSLALGVFDSGLVTYGPVTAAPAGLVMTLALPVITAQTEIGEGAVVGVLVLTAPVTNALSDTLAPLPLAAEGEVQRLLQWHDGVLSRIDPSASPTIRTIGLAGFSAQERQIPFSGRLGLDGRTDVFSYGLAVEGPRWWVLQEQAARVAKGALRDHATAAVTVAVLVVIAVVVAFGAFWWRLANEHNSARADQYRTLARRIAAQKQLLDGINNTIVEQIGLKDAAGAYRFVNPAFAQAVGRPIEAVIGLDDAALFGAGTAERLRLTDEQARRGEGVVTSSEEIYLGKELHYMQISKVPYEGESADDQGIVSVMRDVTELVEEQKKREHAMQQMVGALVRAVELRDPYLAGHSRRVASFASEVAKRMGADAAQVMTVEIAANLSQIGKLKVPRAILTKPDRLEPEEIEEVKRHLEHAAVILKDIDFDLPVLETIRLMHERLDGTGYPDQLSGDAISLEGRILAVCDVFCARVEPRSYRSVIPAETALEILADNADRYAPDVVAALGKVVASVVGEKLLASIDAA